jgi:hypothetical protein
MMNRKVAVLFSLALLVAPAIARQSAGNQGRYGCSLTEATAPAIRGIRLGMTKDQVLDLFRKSLSKDDIDLAIEASKEKSETGLTYLMFQVPTGGANTPGPSDSVRAGLRDGRVVEIAVQYPQPSWDNVDQWVNKLSETLKLPGARAWVPGASDNPTKILKCKEVEIEAGYQGGGGSIRISKIVPGLAAPAGVRDKLRDSFKP